MGLVGAGTNVAYDSVMNQYKPTATAADLYVSGAFGFGLGALSGGAASLKHIGALDDEVRALREWGMREGKKGMRDELGETLPKPPTREAVPPPPGWNTKLDDWLNDKPPERPPVSIIHGPEKPAPSRSLDEPSGPPRLDEAPPVKAPGGVPGDATTGKPWEAKWDKPVYREHHGAKDTLDLPSGLKKISHFADYIRTFSKQKDIVALMDRALKGIDLRQLKFEVIDSAAGIRRSKLTPAVSRTAHQAYGAVYTPSGSSGNGLEMYLRGRGWGENSHGLNEETFVHELLHAATVYKMNRVHGGNTSGMKVESIKAVKELNNLYEAVKVHAQGRTLPANYENFMKNSKEFISYGLTSRPFQEFLKSVEVPGTKTTLWTKFTDGLRKMLGMSPTEANAYARLIDLRDQLTRKAGIEGKGALQHNLVPTSSHIDFQDAAAANTAGVSPVFGWGLGLEHKLMGKKLPQGVRNLASKMFGTTVGHKDHAVVSRNAYDDTVMRAEGWTADMRKTTYGSFTKWFDEAKRPFHEKGEAFEDFGTQVGNYVRGFDGDFHPEVKRAGDHLRKLYGDVADEINNPALRSGGNKKGLTESEVLDEATGQTMLIGKLQKNANYLPRKHDAKKWDEMVRNWSPEAVEGWWARAFHAANPERTAEEAAQWAGWYKRTVEEAHMNRSADHLEEMMTGYDEKALLESLVRNGGFSEKDAHEVIRGMFKDPSSDAGRTASSLRHRNTINETHTEKWKKADGTEADITINDFIRSNALDVSESYFRRTASSVALADNMGIYKQSDIGRMIDDATTKKFGDEGFSEAAAVQAKKDLKFAMDRIQGIPQEEFSTLNKSMAMWRDFNVIRLMGGAVWNQVTEMSQIVGSMGWKAALGAVGELRALKRDIATGKAPHDFLDHLENTIGGVGSEYVARLDFSPKDDWVRYKGDTSMNRKLDALDSGLKKVAKGVLDYTGMTGTMIQQKRIHAIALTNHFVNAANGAPSKFLSKDRLSWMGMSEADYGKLNDAIKAHSKGAGKGDFGAKVDFDIKGFAKAEPEMNSMLMNALHRETRRVVQENDLASMVPLMGTTLGKTVFQFMNFSIHGWNKSMLFAMNHKDFSTLSTVLHGSFFASLAYMGRTQLGALGMDADQREEYLNKRLDTKQIVANSFGRISQASLLPTAYDTTLGNFTGAMFAGTRTTSDVTSFASNPTLQAVNGVLSLGKMVRNGASDDLQTTQRDIKTWGRLLPMNNTALVAPFLNALANDYPTSEDATK